MTSKGRLLLMLSALGGKHSLVRLRNVPKVGHCERCSREYIR